MRSRNGRVRDTCRGRELPARDACFSRQAVGSCAGVKLVAIPAAGKLSEARQALERTRRWRRGYRWRAGIEGRIASLRRDCGWRRSDYHGPDGMERWLGLGAMESLLRRIALAKHQ